MKTMSYLIFFSFILGTTTSYSRSVKYVKKQEYRNIEGVLSSINGQVYLKIFDETDRISNLFRILPENSSVENDVNHLSKGDFISGTGKFHITPNRKFVIFKSIHFVGLSQLIG